LTLPQNPITNERCLWWYYKRERVKNVTFIATGGYIIVIGRFMHKYMEVTEGDSGGME
jgi:hypothetical protein